MGFFLVGVVGRFRGVGVGVGDLRDGWLGFFFVGPHYGWFWDGGIFGWVIEGLRASEGDGEGHCVVLGEKGNGV